MTYNFLLSKPLFLLIVTFFTGQLLGQYCEGHQIAHNHAMGPPLSLPRKTMCLSLL